MWIKRKDYDELKRLAELKTRHDSMVIPCDDVYETMCNYAWYTYDANALLQFYKLYEPINNIHYDQLNNFYKVWKGSNKSPLMHYPLARSISKAMSALVFSDEPQINIVTGNKQRDKVSNMTLKKIFDENSMRVLLQRASEICSYSGAVTFALVFDKEVSEYPIIQLYAKEDTEVEKKYGKITKITCKDYFTNDAESKTYTLYSSYSRGSISYKLYDSTNTVLKEVPLSTVEECKNLKDITIVNSNNEPYQNLLAVYKENNGTGKSDYFNIKDDFLLLDETVSAKADFIRKSRIRTFLYDNNLLQNEKGEVIKPTEFDMSYIVLHDSCPSDMVDRQTPKRDVIDIKASIEAYDNTITNIIKEVCHSVGLSPATLGIDAAGANSSALALEIRENLSLFTRAEKIKEWRDILEKLVKVLFESSLAILEDDILYINSLDIDVSVVFGEYSRPSFENMVNVLGMALDNRLIDLDSALKELYPEKNDIELDIMKANITNELPTEKELIDTALKEETENI